VVCPGIVSSQIVVACFLQLHEKFQGLKVSIVFLFMYCTHWQINDDDDDDDDDAAVVQFL